MKWLVLTDRITDEKTRVNVDLISTYRDDDSGGATITCGVFYVFAKERADEIDDMINASVMDRE